MVQENQHFRHLIHVLSVSTDFYLDWGFVIWQDIWTIHEQKIQTIMRVNVTTWYLIVRNDSRNLRVIPCLRSTMDKQILWNRCDHQPFQRRSDPIKWWLKINISLWQLIHGNWLQSVTSSMAEAVEFVHETYQIVRVMWKKLRPFSFFSPFSRQMNCSRMQIVCKPVNLGNHILYKALGHFSTESHKCLNPRKSSCDCPGNLTQKSKVLWMTSNHDGLRSDWYSTLMHS